MTLMATVAATAFAQSLADSYKHLLESIQTAEVLLDDLGGQYYDDLFDEMAKAQAMYDQHTATEQEVEEEIAVLDGLIGIGRQFKTAYDVLGTLIVKLQEGIDTYKETCSPTVLQQAQELLLEVEDAFYYIDRTTIEEMNDCIARVEKVLSRLPLPSFINDDEEPQDYTDRIQNPGFENGLEGWTNDPVFQECKPTNWATMIDGTYMTGKYYVNLFTPANYAHGGSLHQVITGLPAGKYYAGASVFSNRNGLVFFANDQEVSIPIGPEKAPFGAFFGAYITIAEGETLTIGVRTNEAVEFWGAADNFTLTRYVSNTSGVESHRLGTVREKTVYTLTGSKAAPSQKGIGIVRYADGSVRKVVVK